jgi:molybdate/tungstate transport system substrate-binding protein
MTAWQTRLRHVTRAAIVTAACALFATACSSNPGGGGSNGGKAKGTVSVACAGSLTKLYTETLGPDFQKATGAHWGGPPCAGSLALAQEIESRAISPQVFLAVGAKPIEGLFPSRAKFAINLATDPLVFAYSEKSRYARQLDAIASGAKPLSDLFSVMGTPGFRLGRSDPTQDPQGEFFILMVMLAEHLLHLRAGTADRILGISPSAPDGSSSQMLSEDALPTDEAEGIVDGGSAYLSQALQFGLKYVKLPDALNFSNLADKATYATVSINVAGTKFTGKLITLDEALILPAAGSSVSAADSAAADAFLAYLLQPSGRSLLARAGYTLEPPTVVLAPGVNTPSSVLPALVLSAFNADHGKTTT